MAPINLPNGNQVSEIVLPNGQTASEVIAPDGSTVFDNAIPDSGLKHQYDWSDGSTTTSTVPDLAGNADLTGTFTDLSASINGVQAGTFDGSDDNVSGSFATVSQPFEVFHVFVQRTTVGSNTKQHYSDGSTSFGATSSGGDWFMSDGSAITDGADDTNAHIVTSVFSSNAELRVDAVTEVTGSLSTGGLSALTVGSNSSNDNYADLDLGELLVYDGSATGYSRGDVESYLSDKWGITI